MTVNLLMVMLSSLDLILFHGVPTSNQCLIQVPRSSISLWLMSLQKLCGFNLFLRSCVYLLLQKLDFGVIIWWPSTSHLIPYFMAKHIEVDYHFVHDQVMQRKLDVRFISTHNQLADGFTKSLPQQRFSDFCNNLNLDKL
jgi:hypothetical protein